MDDIKILEQIDVDRVYTALTQDNGGDRNIRSATSTPMTGVIPENEEFVNSLWLRIIILMLHLMGTSLA